MPALQPAVALAMTAYVRARFQPRAFGLEHLRLEPGTILAVSHRSDDDVPVLIWALYRRWSAAVARGLPWPTFAVDQQVFLPGFLAGYPAKMPAGLRRLLWPIRVGGVLERHLQCVPVREPTRVRLVELLRAAPEEPLDDRLPPELAASLRDRAARLGRPAPERAADVIGGAYADLLWTIVDRRELPGPDEVWRAHLRAAVSDFRRLVLAVRSGGLVVIFPEGEPSSDGAIGRLRSGLASLARRSRARHVQPIAIAYDPLTRGRTRAYISVAPVLEPSPRELEQAVTAALRAATPLTPGQIAAATLVAAAVEPSSAAVERAAAEWLARADAVSRPVESVLTRRGRKPALREALTQADRRGAQDREIRRLARELESAHS